VVRAEELSRRQWSNPVQLSAENQPVKRKLGGRCEMAASPGPSQGSSVEWSLARKAEKGWCYTSVDSRQSSSVRNLSTEAEE
jgi:hypothetical protein